MGNLEQANQKKDKDKKKDEKKAFKKPEPSLVKLGKKKKEEEGC
jgi:hypothetical protein